MSKVEYKGKHFLEITPGEIKPMAKLRCDLFLYLPLNHKMLKLRDRNFEIDQASLDFYFQEKKYKCFILDPAEHKDVYDFTSADLANLNPNLPQEIIEKFNIPEVFEESKKRSVVDAEFADFEQSFSSDTESPDGKRIRGNSNAEEEPGQSFSADSAETISQTVRGNSDVEEETEQSFSGDGKESEQLQRVKGSKLKEDETEQSFSPEEIAQEKEEQRLKAAAIEAELERQFAADDAEEESQTKIWGDAEPEQITKIGSDIQGIEEKLSILKPDSSAFTEELKRISAGGELKDESEWRSSLEEVKAREFEASQEDKATTKLALELSEHLAKLRGELGKAQRSVATNAEEKQKISERKKELRGQIQRLEGVSTVLESLDTDMPEKEDLPEHLQGKDRSELLADLEIHLGELKGSVLLSAEEHAFVAKKIWKVKAKEFAYSADGLTQLAKEIGERLTSLKDPNTENKIEESEIKEINSNIDREIKKAQLSRNITLRINSLREEFSYLLDEKPKDDKQKVANEERSAELRKEISTLDQLTASVELGEQIPANDEMRFQEKVDATFFLVDGPELLPSMDSSIGKILALESELIKIKMAAAEQAKRLSAKIFGEESELLEEKVDAKPVIPELSNGLENIMNEIEKNKEQFSSFQEADLHRLDESISAEVRRATVVANIERAIATKQMSLQIGLNDLAHLVSASVETSETESKDIKIQDEIKHLLDLRDEAEISLSLDNPELEAFMPENVEEVFFVGAKKFSDGKKKALATVDPVKSDVAKSKEIVDKNKEKIEIDIETVGTLAIRKNSIEARNLGRAQKKLSRFMVEFLSTGKEIDPKALWELTSLVDKEVRAAKAEMQITQQMLDMTAELNAVKGIVAASPEASADDVNRVKSLQVKIGELEAQRRILEKGGEIPAGLLESAFGELPEEFRFSQDTPTLDEAKKISQSLERLGNELVQFKRDSLDAVEDIGKKIKSGEIPLPHETLVKDHNAEERAVEAKFRNLVSGSDGKDLQAGVYAATIFRFFGYHTKDIEEDLILASLLRSFNRPQVEDGFPSRVQEIWSAAQPNSKPDEMILRDLGQAAKMANKYLDSPKVITGKLAIDPKLFNEFCSALVVSAESDFDFELVERARSMATIGLGRQERDRLVDVAKQVNKKVESWRRLKSAS